MGQFGPFRLYLINSTKVNSLKVANFGSMDILESHGDILQPGGQLETPGLVSYYIHSRYRKNPNINERRNQIQRFDGSSTSWDEGEWKQKHI